MSSVGHIRKDTKVDVPNDFAVTYEIDPDHKKIVADLKKAVKETKTVWLATDEDREGESISWHLLEVLKLPKDTNRITFHEITEPALKAAIKNPRHVDMNMVSSQQARQTLDMLVGYDLSGVVRKKVPGAISAGRVQSPALRLIVEREREIEKFESKYTYKVTGNFSPISSDAVLNGTLEKITPASEESVKALLEVLKTADFVVGDISETEAEKANPTPFTTAALQIEANSRLGFSSSTTMRAAQSLYQAGAITYHRTDSLNLSNQALGAIGNYIERTFGKEYLHIRKFHTKDASAQEAHEAIRPTHIEVATAGKSEYEKKLYNLIRSRTLATQMANAKVNRTTVSIEAQKDGKVIQGKKAPAIFVAKGETIVFDGFLKVYGSSKETTLPKLETGEKLEMRDILARQTFAKPPARYTEGALVKKLEELGIGRPSTYASIMTAISARGYVIKGESEGNERKITEFILNGEKPVSEIAIDFPVSTISETKVSEKTGATKGKLVPTPVGELVSDFLKDHFDEIVDYKFTAGVEEKLDKIAEAKLSRVKMLSEFYRPFSEKVIASDGIERYNSATLLGVDPETGKNIYAKIGRNGGFIQLGEGEKESGQKPRFAPLPPRKTVKTVALTDALKQLALPELPRTVGKASDGTEIIAANGPFGPYLKAGNFNISLSKTEKDQSPYTISLETAEALYIKKRDSIIADWGEIKIIEGPYGPYIKGPAIKPASGKGRARANNVKIPKDLDPKKITKEEAEKLLSEKPKSSSRHAPHKRTKAAKKK